MLGEATGCRGWANIGPVDIPVLANDKLTICQHWTNKAAYIGLTFAQVGSTIWLTIQLQGIGQMQLHRDVLFYV